MYGLKNKQDAVVIAHKVVGAFGGGHRAVRLLLEIAATETHLGEYPDDNPEKLGVGITQFDQIRLDDLKARARGKHRKILKRSFGYDLMNVELADLAYDPLLAFCLTRMVFKLIPDPIPADVPGRARYWKRFWNTYAENAAGTPERYIEDVRHHLVGVSL